jgi:hypothetical protein
MRRRGIIAATIVAVVASCAITTATAAAESPEYLACVKAAVKEQGTFNDGHCTVPSQGGPKEGKFEIGSAERATVRTFKGKLGKFQVFHVVNGITIGGFSCTKGTLKGNVTGAKTSIATLTLLGCTSETKKCTTVGVTTFGELTYGVDGLLVSAPGSSSGVGLELSGSGPGHEWGEFSCEGLEEVLSGALTAEVTGDVGVLSKTQTLTFAVNGSHEPLLEAAEPLVTHVTPPGMDFDTGVTMTIANGGTAFEIV